MEREHEGGLGPEFVALLHRIDERDDLEAQQGIRNWLLAPTLEIYRALQRGEQVPLHRLNETAVRVYGLHKRGAA
jgi:hypothetical protein